MTKPLLLFFPGAGPPGEVAATLGQLLPEVEVAGMTYPGWPDLTDPCTAMDRILQRIAAQTEAIPDERRLLIVGYSLGAQMGWAYAQSLRQSGRAIALFGAIDGRVVEADKPDGRWVRRALGELAGKIARGDGRAVWNFAASRMARLVQRLAADRLPRLAGRWAERARLPWPLSRSPAFAQELSMRLLIGAAISWMNRIAPALPPLACPAILIRVADNGRLDERWRALCPHMRIATVEGDHHAILQSPLFEDVVARVKAAARELVALDE